jgi:uncharacterized protein YaeQ
MALKATIHKAALQIADLDRNYYGDHALTLAQHPSETEERVMVRLLAFALNASEPKAGEALEFGRGISSDDEPALWLKDLTGNIRLWIEVGLPDPKLLRRASGRAGKVRVYAFGARATEMWWRSAAADVARLANLEVVSLPGEGTQALAALVQRNMQLQCTIQEGHVLLTDGTRVAELDMVSLQSTETH